jgi:DNA-binding IclR family transcriptional regulator
LFFELSHPRRLAILAMLRDDSLRLSQVASHGHMAPPEASRHLTWLTAQGLLQRHPDGTFRLTGYGLLIAEGVASF